MTKSFAELLKLKLEIQQEFPGIRIGQVLMSDKGYFLPASVTLRENSPGLAVVLAFNVYERGDFEKIRAAIGRSVTA